MALDELSNEKDNSLINNDINIVYDDSLKSFVETSSKMVIDFRETPHGSGFIIDNGSYC